MTVNVDTLSNTKWRICVFINIDRLMEIEQRFLATTIIVSGIVLIIGILLFTAVARTITTPIKQLEAAMRKVEKSDYFRMEEVELAASGEVEALARRFNRMMHKIAELMQNVIDEQNAQRQSELRALQNQINPHFLYNTLDSIVWLIENEKNIDASNMVIALAKLFRIGISNDSDEVPLRDEIEHVRNYLLIQKIRYPDSFDYEFEIDEAALDIRTLKLILQPLVENSIYHGLKNKIDKGKIQISARIKDGYLFLSVSDNGYGMRQEKIDALLHSFAGGTVSNNVGLKNIYQRVMIYHGKNAEMRIDSELDVGTTIIIKEPLNRP
jgi:two-component system sensor histidine kinase YesM